MKTDGKAHMMATTIIHGDFWKEGGEGETMLGMYLTRYPIPEGLRYAVRDLAGEITTDIADVTARIMQAIMESPGLRKEYLRTEDDWNNESDLPAFKALLLTTGLLGGNGGGCVGG